MMQHSAWHMLLVTKHLEPANLHREVTKFFVALGMPTAVCVTHRSGVCPSLPSVQHTGLSSVFARCWYYSYQQRTADLNGVTLSSRNHLQTGTRETALNRGRTDHISLTHDHDLQSPASYGHDLLTCRSSRSTISRLKR